MSHSSVRHYRQHPSHTLEYFHWTSLWKEPEVKIWLTEMTSADQSEERGPCRLGPAVRASRVPSVTRRKAYTSWAGAAATQHQTIICDPTMFHNNNPNVLKEEEMKVSGNFFFYFWRQRKWFCSSKIKEIRPNNPSRYVILWAFSPASWNPLSGFTEYYSADTLIREF